MICHPPTHVLVPFEETASSSSFLSVRGEAEGCGAHGSTRSIVRLFKTDPPAVFRILSADHMIGPRADSSERFEKQRNYTSLIDLETYRSSIDDLIARICMKEGKRNREATAE